MKDAMISWFIDTLGGKVGGGFIVFLISMVPILELRGGLLQPDLRSLISRSGRQFRSVLSEI